MKNKNKIKIKINGKKLEVNQTSTMEAILKKLNIPPMVNKIIENHIMHSTENNNDRCVTGSYVLPFYRMRM